MKKRASEKAEGGREQENKGYSSHWSFYQQKITTTPTALVILSTVVPSKLKDKEEEEGRRAGGGEGREGREGREGGREGREGRGGREANKGYSTCQFFYQQFYLPPTWVSARGLGGCDVYGR